MIDLDQQDRPVDPDIAFSYIVAMKVVVYLRSAQRDMDKLPPRPRDQIETKLARYAATGAGDVKALVGEPGARLRSGDYRVVFTESGDAITVRAVRNRRDVYRR